LIQKAITTIVIGFFDIWQYLYSYQLKQSSEKLIMCMWLRYQFSRITFTKLKI